MKKTLSLFLAAVMLICSFTISGFAYTNTVTFDSSASFTESNQLVSGCEYIIPEGVTMTVPSGISLTLPTECLLRVAADGKLVVLGDIIIYGTGSLIVDGELSGGNKVSFNKDATGDAQVRISYPALADVGLANHISSLAFYTADTPTSDITEDTSWTEITGSSFNPEGGYFYAPLNSNFFVKVTFIDDEKFPKYDCSKFNVFFNGVGLAYSSGYYSSVLGTSGELSFSDWTNDSDFYRTCKIQLPTGVGYEVEGRDYEVSSDGTVYLKYGTTFAFKVNLDEEYDMSVVSVYVFNGYGYLNYPVSETDYDSLAMKPDEYGYYVISPVNSDYTVTVSGIVENSTINLIGNIVETIRNIFNMIKEFFGSFDFDLGSLFDFING